MNPMSSIAPLLVAASAAIVLLLGYLFLAKRYFFSIPLRGILLATFLYALALIVNWA